MCTNKVAIETHSRTRGAKRRAFGRPALSYLVPVDSPVDSTFERSENFAIHSIKVPAAAIVLLVKPGLRDNRVKVRPACICACAY